MAWHRQPSFNSRSLPPDRTGSATSSDSCDSATHWQRSSKLVEIGLLNAPPMDWERHLYLVDGSAKLPWFHS